MTTYELAARLARQLKKGNLTALSGGATQDVVDAMNAGLQECYERLPAWQRQTMVDVTLAAPVTVNLSVVNGSVDLGDGGSVFLESQIGRSVVVSGDTNWNEVQSTTKLLHPYQGETGVVVATIYGDSAYNDLTNFDGFASNPRMSDGSREILKAYNARLEGKAPQVGRPCYYWAEPAGASLGATPAVYLRFFPAPNIAYVLRMEMEFRPSILTYAMVNQAGTIPLADQLLHTALLPLCDEALLRSPEWADPSKVSIVQRAAERARDFLSRQRPSATLPANRAFTPPGY